MSILHIISGLRAAHRVPTDPDGLRRAHSAAINETPRRYPAPAMPDRFDLPHIDGQTDSVYSAVARASWHQKATSLMKKG